VPIPAELMVPEDKEEGYPIDTDPLPPPDGDFLF